jgi:hypothetical protein
MRFFSIYSGIVIALSGCGCSLRPRASSSACGNYMVSICLAARLYAEDHDGQLPSDLLSISNEVSTPKILICPGDPSRQLATNWAAFALVDSSYEIPSLGMREGDTNQVFLRCRIHGNFAFGDGSVFVNGRHHRKK